MTSNATTQARVDSIVGNIAYAQAHGARAVLDEAIRNGAHLPPAVQVALVEARQACAAAEVATKALGTTVEACRLLREAGATEVDPRRPFQVVATGTVTA